MLTLALIMTACLAQQAPQQQESPPGAGALRELSDLLREAEANHPALAAANHRILASESIPSQAEALDDPVARVSYTNVGFDSLTLGEEDAAILTLSWSQALPYPGKRRLAGDAARGEVEVSRRQLDLIRLEIAALIKRAYAELYHSDRTSQIVRENRELLRSFLDTARARYETGEGLLQNVLKAQTEISKLDAELEMLLEERRTAQVTLNTLAGRSVDAAVGPALALPGTTSPIEPADLEREAVARSPQLLEREAAIRREQARLDLARRQLKPDLTWGAAYGYRSGLDPEITGSLGVRLPLYQNRKQAQGVVQASHQLDAARSELDAARLSVVAEVRRLAARYERAEALSRLYAEGVIPQARNALESAGAAYGVGRVDFLTLLSDFSTMLAYEKESVTQRHEQVLVLADLEKLTAKQLLDLRGAP